MTGGMPDCSAIVSINPVWPGKGPVPINPSLQRFRTTSLDCPEYNPSPEPLQFPASFLESHLGNPETTIVSGERYICAVPGGPIRYPDLLVAFDSDPELYEANNGYVVSFQGKPPELALEIASRHTWRTDIEVKPGFYASLGVREYWRFDETGEFHGTRLAGDRLVNGQYHPITVDELPDGELRGYSETLGLYFCWRQGRLDWYDPSAEDYIPSLESERQLRQQAEERVRQLEAELRRRG